MGLSPTPSFLQIDVKVGDHDTVKHQIVFPFLLCSCSWWKLTFHQSQHIHFSHAKISYDKGINSTAFKENHSRNNSSGNLRVLPHDKQERVSFHFAIGPTRLTSRMASLACVADLAPSLIFFELFIINYI